MASTFEGVDTQPTSPEETPTQHDFLGDLALRARMGDEEALRTLYPHILELTAAIASRLHPENSSAASEITHKSVARVYDKAILEGLFTPGSFVGWVQRVTTNIAIDAGRKQQRHPVTAMPPERFNDIAQSGPVGDGETSIKVGETHARIGAACEEAGLNEVFKLPFLLHHVAGYGYEELAAMFDVPIGTIRSRIHRAKIVLAEAPRTKQILTASDEL